MNFKWMMMAGALGVASMGLAGCGDDDDAPCESNADCGGSEACVGPEDSKVCRTMCGDDATVCNEDTQVCGVADGDASGVLVCNPFSGSVDECVEDTDCATGESCVSAVCVPDDTPLTCESTAECIDETAYCGGTGDNATCLGVACGDPLNAGCTRCSSGPNGGDRAAAGPVIFVPAQEGACTQDPNLCLPGAAPWACVFSFIAFDDEGDLPTSGLSGPTGKIKVLSSAGAEQPVFGTTNNASGNNRKYTFTACFPDTQNGGIGTAAVLRDAANNASNTLCISGNLP